MHIKVEEWEIEDSSSFKILKINKCCDRFLKSKNIVINKEWDELDENFDYENPRYSVKLERRDFVDEDFGDEYFYETIDFCPFCGEEIIIDVTIIVDKTKEYNLLTKKRELLNNKRRKTDSKKKCEEYDSQIRELDRQINNINTSDEDLKRFEGVN